MVGEPDPVGAGDEAVADEEGALGATLDDVEAVGLGVMLGDAQAVSRIVVATMSETTLRRGRDRNKEQLRQKRDDVNIMTGPPPGG